MIKILQISFWLLVLISKSIAQNFPYLNFTIKDGLPANYVYGVIEDSEGYIWAYTENGISKYDGYEWNNFTTKDGLIGNDVPTAFKSKCGDLWFLSFEANTGVKVKDGKIIPSEIPFKAIFQMDDEIVFVNNEILFLLDCKDNVTSKFTPVTPFVSKFNRISAAYSNASNSLDTFYYANNGLIINVIDKKYSINHHNNIIDFLNFTEKTVKKLNLKLEYPQYGDIQRITYHNSHVYVSCSRGLLIFDKLLSIVEKIEFLFLDKWTIALNSFVDSKNNLWVGTRNKGIYIVPKVNRNLSVLSPFIEDTQIIEAIFKNRKGDIYAGSDNGIIYKVGDSLELLHKSEKVLSIKDIAEFNNDTLIYSSLFEKYLIYPDKRVVNLKNYFPVKDYLKYELKNLNLPGQSYLIRSKYITKLNQSLWYSLKSVLKRADIINKNEIKTSLEIISDNVFFMDRFEDTIIFSNTDSLYKVTATSFENYSMPKIKDLSFVKYFKDDIVFIGNSIGELYLYNFHNKTNKLIFNKGLVKDIAIVDDSTSFVSIYNAIFKININCDSVCVLEEINSSTGAPFEEVHDIVIKDSLLYVGTAQGVIKINILNPIFVADTFSNYSLKLIDKTDSPIKNNVISFKDNDFSISHKVTNYASGNKIKYYTKLSPIESSFNFTTLPYTKFQNLNYGSYTFEVYAIDIYGSRYNFDPLKFEISTPIHKTWWFLTLLGFGISSLIYFVFNLKFKVKKNELSILKQMNSLKLSALQSQMNPHFIFNALGAVQYFIQTHDTEKADEYLSDFAKLIRRILESSKVKTVTIEDEIEMLTLYIRLEEARFETLFKTKIVVDENLDLSIQIPPMIIQPFVENAINHGLYNLRDRKGELYLHFKPYKDNGIMCQIIDNGIGINAAREIKKIKGHKSRGMQLIEEKINALKKSKEFDITIKTDNLSKNGLANGTKIIIIIESIFKYNSNEI